MLSQTSYDDTSLFRFFIWKLAIVELIVESFVCQQGLVISLLDDLAIFEDKDFICFLNGRQAVSNDKASPPFHQILHRFLNQEF